MLCVREQRLWRGQYRRNQALRQGRSRRRSGWSWYAPLCAHNVSVADAAADHKEQSWGDGVDVPSSFPQQLHQRPCQLGRLLRCDRDGTHRRPDQRERRQDALGQAHVSAVLPEGGGGQLDDALCLSCDRSRLLRDDGLGIEHPECSELQSIDVDRGGDKIRRCRWRQGRQCREVGREGSPGRPDPSGAPARMKAPRARMQRRVALRRSVCTRRGERCMPQRARSGKSCTLAC